MTTGDVVASNLSSVDVKLNENEIITLSSVDVKLNENEDIIDKKAQKKVCKTTRWITLKVQNFMISLDICSCNSAEFT